MSRIPGWNLTCPDCEPRPTRLFAFPHRSSAAGANGRYPLTPHNHLQIIAHLRQEIEPALAQAVVETVVLRQKAAVKFSRAAQMYFTREALEQASAEPVAQYRAARFAGAGLETVADLGCGIGGDALALTQNLEVVGIDLDEMRLRLARENVRVYEGSGCSHPLQADIQTLPPLPVAGVFLIRRGGMSRAGAFIWWPITAAFVGGGEVAREGAGTAVKISPGVRYEEIPADAEVEFISLNGEVKEGVLWFDELRTGAARRATLLPGGHSLVNRPGLEIPLSEPLAYLYEPDGGGHPRPSGARAGR
ncbi:MAG: class I SAM-dependent methyltransferase [Chloroflexi bacterium]|nr:class I SAM-dependent methyltransferase [Chloroflexota bacterium]